MSQTTTPRGGPPTPTAAPAKPLPLDLPPGIRRDGAFIEGDLQCTDGQWVRFDRQRPRKMGGYQRINNGLPELVRGLYVNDFTGQVNVMLGSASKLGQVTLPNGLPGTAYADRTPAGYVSSSQTLWQFDQMFDAASSQSVILAHPGQNLLYPTGGAAMPIYAGNAATLGAFTAPVTPSGGTAPGPVAGGLVVSGPYAFYYDDAGFVTWSVPNTPGDVSVTNGGGGVIGAGGGARIAKSKILKALTYRGGTGSSPAVLFWSVNSLDLASFNGTPTWFSFTNISDNCTLLSSRCPVEYDGRYYWWGLDRFYMFLGFVQEVPNNTNLDWFMKNLNRAYATKVFSFTVPRRGEVWTCAPMFGATECNWAIIYNVRNGSWYDTPLPNLGRCDGAYAHSYGVPFMTGIQQDQVGYKLWRHEEGTDEVDGTQVNAIRSFFTTGNLAPVTTGKNLSLFLDQVELDAVQSGGMTFQVAGRQSARGPDTFGARLPFSPTDELLHPKETRRYMRLTFESNTLGGDYLMGTPVLRLRETGSRAST